MNKEINLNDWLYEILSECNTEYESKGTKDTIKEILRKFSNEIIDLCAENAEADVIFYLSSPSPSTEDYEVFILKDSITEVKDMIK